MSSNKLAQVAFQAMPSSAAKAMQALSQSRFDELLQKQKSEGYGIPEFDIRDADLSSVVFNDRELDATLIALSLFPSTDFDGGFSLNGVTWIGNEIARCGFSGVAMNKSEILDCVFQRCTFKAVSFFDSDLTGTKFEDCAFSAIDLTTACLVNAEFIRCQFDNVLLANGQVLSSQRDLRFDEQGAPLPSPQDGLIASRPVQ